MPSFPRNGQEPSSTSSECITSLKRYKEGSASPFVQHLSSASNSTSYLLQKNEGAALAISLMTIANSFVQFTAFGSIIVLTLVGVATAANIAARQSVRNDNSMLVIWASNSVVVLHTVQLQMPGRAVRWVFILRQPKCRRQLLVWPHVHL